MTVESLRASLADRYLIERELGHGGMATVYLAEDLKHRRKVAIKVLRPELSAVIGAERFVREIETIAALQHPHILGLIDSGEVSGTAYYVMPFVEGESLRGRLSREKQLPIPDAIRLATEVASALDYAHRHGVIHRDIKPENILLHDGQALVADFGIALAVTQAGGTRMTETGMSLGTPHYMSPEQAMGQREITARSDIYALGCVTYEMLLGEPPFTGPTAQAIVARVMTEEPRPLTVIRKTIPSYVEAAILTALEKLPADRFASAAAFSEALAGTRVDTQPRTRVKRKRVWFLPHDKASWARVGAGVMLGALSTWLVTRNASTRADPEPRQWAIALDDSLPLYTSRDQYGTATRSLDLSPDGRSLVYVSGSAANQRLVSVNLISSTSSVIRGTVGARTPTFAPDGQALAAVVGDSEIRRYSLSDGAAIRLGSGAPGVMAWHSNGRIYYNGGCWTAPAGGGASTPFIKLACRGNWVYSEIALIPPNPQWVLLHVLGRISVASTSTGEVRPLLVPNGSDTADSWLLGSSPRYVSPGYLIFVNGNTLLAAPFDAKRLRLTGEPRAVLANVRREQSATAQLAISNDGALVWASGADGGAARFVWVDRAGKVTDTLRFIPPVEVGSYALTEDGRRLAYNAVAADGTATLMIADLGREAVDRVAFPYRLDPMAWIQRDAALSVIMFRSDNTTRPAVVRFDGPVPVLDTTVQALEVESREGNMVCRPPIYGAEAQPPMRVVRLTEPHDSVTFNADDGNCSFTPDGRFVLWTGQDGLFVAPTNPLGLSRRVRVGPSFVEPRWSSDGREIEYRSQSAWYAVLPPGSALRPAGAPRLLFRGDYLQAYASWAPGPDGRFLLLVGEPPVLKSRLNVITNVGRYIAQKLERSP